MLDSIENSPKELSFDLRQATLQDVHRKMTGVIESILLVATHCDKDARRSGWDFGAVLNNGADLLSDINVEISEIMDCNGAEFARHGDDGCHVSEPAKRTIDERELCFSLATKLPGLWRKAETQGDDSAIHASITSVVDLVLSTQPQTLADVATQLTLSGDQRLERAAILVARLAELDLRQIAGERFLDELQLPVKGDAAEADFRSDMHEIRRKIAGVLEMLALVAGRSDCDVSGILTNDAWILSRINAEIGALIEPTRP